MQRKKLKGSTISSALRPLSIILAQAARRGRIPVNPFSQLERGERPKHDDQRPKRILTLDEMHALIEHADSEPYRCLLELLLTTGLRIGEALGLTVADLDPDHALIRVEYQLGRDGNRTPLKTEESRRAIDIPPATDAHDCSRSSLNAAPASTRTRSCSRAETAPASNAKSPAKPSTAPPKPPSSQHPKPTLHDLRHSHASMLIALDYNLVDVQRRLGHRKPDTTLRVYAHQWRYREAQRSQIGAELGNLFRQLQQPALPAPSPAAQPLAFPQRHNRKPLPGSLNLCEESCNRRSTEAGRRTLRDRILSLLLGADAAAHLTEGCSKRYKRYE